AGAGIAELVRAEGSELADQFLRPDLDLLEVLSRDLARTGRAHLGHENDIGPKGLQNPSALDRVSFRHDGDHPVAPEGTDNRQPDSHVPAREFDDGAAMAKPAGALGIFDDPQRDPVLAAFT